MKKNKLTRFIFADDYGRFPDNTCDLISNLLKAVIVLLIMLPILLIMLLSPLLLLTGYASFGGSNALSAFASTVLVMEIIFILGGFTLVSFDYFELPEQISNIIDSIKNKICFKVEWKD